MKRIHLLLAILPAIAACSGGAPPAPAATPFGISGIESEIGTDSITLRWTTSEPATGTLHWGPAGSIDQLLALGDNGLTHQAQLGGLSPQTTYGFWIESVRPGGASAQTEPFELSTAPLPAFSGDDFDAANLDLSHWTLIDPTGGAELRLSGPGALDATLELETPAGVDADSWTGGNGAPRIAQAAPSGDFGIEVRFDSALDVDGTGQGIFVEVDADTFLRFDFAFNSNKVQVFAAHLDAGAVIESFTDIAQSGPLADGTPLWMRVTRSGQMWTQEWSSDGQTFLPGAQFTLAEDPTLIGLTTLAAGTGHAGHLMRADYILDLAESLAQEDASPRVDDEAPYLYRAVAEAVGDSAVRLRWWSDEPSSASVRYGQDTAYTQGTLEVADQLYAHELLIDGLAADTTHHFQIIARDAGGRETYSSDLSATTGPPGSTGLPTLELWYADAEPDGSYTIAFGQLGNPQHQVNILGNLSDDDEDRIALSNSLYYQLNGGKWKLLALGDDPAFNYEPWRLAHEGDFNLELEQWELTQVAPSGGVYHNEVLFEALDDDGHATYVTLHVDYTSGVTWNPSVSIDWSSTSRIQDVAQVVDGDWYIDSHPTLGPGLRLRPDALGYDRLVAIGEGEGPDSWENYEVTVSATALGFDPAGWTDGTQSYAMGLGLRWSGHNTGWGFNQPKHNIYPFGGIFVYRWFETFERWELWINKDEAIIPFDAPISVGTTYRFKARCETQPGGGTRYRLKRWEEGQPEPGTWDMDFTTDPVDDHPTGSLLLISHHVDVLFGNVEVTPL